MRRGQRRFAVVIALLALPGGARPCRAADAGPRVVVSADGRDAFLRESATRLAAELGAAGFTAVRLEAPAGVPVEAASLAQLGAAHDCVAAFALLRARTEGRGPSETDADAVEVWLWDRLTGKTTLRRLALGPAADEPALLPTALAIRAVELLRASLVELSWTDTHTSGAAPPAPAVARLYAPVRPPPAPDPVAGTSLAVGGGALVSLTKPALPASLVPLVRASFALPELPAPAPRALGLWVAAPGLARDVRASAGAASVRQELALVLAQWAGRRQPGRPVHLSPRLGIGAGVYHLSARGLSGGPLLPQSAEVWSFASGLAVGLALRLGSSLAVAADVTAIATWPGAALALGDTEAGRAGRPSLLGTLEVAWGF